MSRYIRGFRWTPVVTLPWYGRWTIGVAGVLLVALPLLAALLVYHVARACCAAFWKSEAWDMLAACTGAIVFGDGRDA